ncbi:MAG: ATP-binding cassette domain-containing protein [Anaerolineales bacterium]|nr:ATP-binding cassette domain-containing protein [Anaerolineales bacterium]MCB8958933.1 ATP-binding cassette domain-containing protein [Ardenticatenales bacterium]
MQANNNSPSPRLIVSGMRVWRDTTMILDGIDWQVNRGEHWAILGANGSGKSSLILSISGYLSYSEGRLFLLDGWHGEFHMPTQRKRLGVVSPSLAGRFVRNVPEATALQVVMTGRYASFWLVDEYTDAHAAEARAILGRLNCLELAEKTFSTMSSGERQIIMLARTIMARAELILLDEPCTSLDPGAREEYLSVVQTLTRLENGPTLIFITHHPEEIMPGISHVLLMGGGKVLARGPKKEVLTAANLSQTFSYPLDLINEAGRYWVRGKI